MGRRQTGAGLRCGRNRRETGGQPGRGQPSTSGLRPISARSIAECGTGGTAGAAVDDETLEDAGWQGAFGTAVHEANFSAATEECDLPRPGVASERSICG